MGPKLPQRLRLEKESLSFWRSNPLGTRSAPSGEPAVNRRLEKLTAQSWAVLFFERLWRAILPPLVVTSAFVSLSWTGIWLDAPSWARGLGIALFVLAISVSLLPARKLRWPTRKEALDRIDEASGLSLRPAASLADRLGNGAGNPITRRKASSVWSDPTPPSDTRSTGWGRSGSSTRTCPRRSSYTGPARRYRTRVCPRHTRKAPASRTDR